MSVQTTFPISRRKLVGLGVAGALGGGIWTTGLGILARGVHPQFFVIGDDSWQLVLVEHGRRRVLLCLGQITGDAVEVIAGLTTSLRQHADVVVGSAEALDWASPASSGWIGAVQVQLNGASLAPSSGIRVHLRDSLDLHIGDFVLALQTLPVNDWRSANTSEPGWIGHLRIADLVVAMAPSMDAASLHAQPDAALVIAPEGNPETLLAYLPGTGVVINGSSLRDLVSRGADRYNALLVRTFPTDIARFRVSDGHIDLPGWTRSI